MANDEHSYSSSCEDDRHGGTDVETEEHLEGKDSDYVHQSKMKFSELRALVLYEAEFALRMSKS